MPIRQGLDAREKHHHFPTLEWPFQVNVAVLIYAMDLKRILCQVDANCRNLHDDVPFDIVAC